MFAQKQFRPSQVVLLGQGVCKGFSSAQVAREIGISRQTVLSIRRVLQDTAQMLQPEDALPDTETETDEMFQNAGEKRHPHLNPSDPPRRRGNKRRGHGTYANDRPPVVGTLGVKVVSCDCVSHIKPMVLRYQHTCFSGRSPLLPYIQMDGEDITRLTAPMR